MTTTFVPPGPGAWGLERTHNSRPMSVLMAELFPAAMMRGFSEGTRYYGVLLDYLEVAIINRFCYMAPRAAGAPKSAKEPPPKLLFKLLQHVNPELKRRIKADVPDTVSLSAAAWIQRPAGRVRDHDPGRHDGHHLAAGRVDR